ncbi:hypothetical protein LTR70_005779 [Exophiala xenobiotica]|uniref:Vps72/YL1 C-terminal domain-containing protein n=1 Tax=Lithohypha guttulata TaxID=1690604 RepID=A0ABR0JV17_9EURO|nr:hypothetical protein LTR24_010197 [Lithohypha guttulata]KAK5317584.1 hypothetical protein LTR70_005779 [Exophiala xenobiotica]
MSDEERASAGRSGSPSEASSSDAEAELMITTRERRKTAGNRYSQVVAQEQADEDEQDDVALLFAEAEGEDDEYNSDEADDEADMSSSDDDDQGPNAAADDIEGETEIQKQAKAERQKKRKADMALTTMGAIRKKPKIDPTSLHRAPERAKPSKRKERVTWLPDEAAAPGRTSLRKQTVAHREVMMERLKESEEQRLKNKAIREEKEKIKQADAPRELTQADRLAEAEKNERRNAKSLNRWEAMEARRAEEQAAKLAALKDRKLHGAVITTHSSKHVYRGPKVERLSPGPSGTDDSRPKKRGPKPKSPFTSIAATNARPHLPSQSPVQAPTPSKTPISQANGDDWLAGIHEYASMQPGSGQITPQEAQDQGPPPQKNSQPVHEAKAAQHVKQPEEHASSTLDLSYRELNRTETEAAPNLAANLKPSSLEQGKEDGTPMKPVDPPESRGAPSSILVNTSSDAQKPPQPGLQQQQQLQPQPSQAPLPPDTSLPVSTLQQQAPIYPPLMPLTSAQLFPEQVPLQAPPVVEVTSTRNVVILDGFEDLTAEAKQAYSVFSGTKKQSKPSKHVGELCAITGNSAKYRDPTTGVPYANMAAFKKLKELQQHTYQWSSMLGCYVGRAGHAARGVPVGFWG